MTYRIILSATLLWSTLVVGGPSSAFGPPPSASNGSVRKALSDPNTAHSAIPQSPTGIWPLWRHDTANTARTDLPGRFTTPPVEVWAYGGLTPSCSFMVPIALPSGKAYLCQFGRGLKLIRPDGSTIWNRPLTGVGEVIQVFECGAERTPVIITTAGNQGYALFDAASGKTLWEWSPPRDAYQGGYAFLNRPGGGTLFAFPQNTIEGMAFDFNAPGPPAQRWHERYPDTYWANFGPYIVLADMDNDGRDDILLAGKPSYFAVIDTDTGKIKFDIHYPVPGHDGTGRPYGLLQAVDIDGDGFRDAVMVSCQVEEYVGIALNNHGQGFRYAWSRFVEHDLPDDLYELRPNLTTVTDLDGDGKREMIVGLFNLKGDQRWHTVVLDPLKGWDTPIADLPDRYFWGCFDLDGDGRPEIITSAEKARRPDPISTFQAVSGATYADLAVVDGASIVGLQPPLPLNTGFYAIRVSPSYVSVEGGPSGIALTVQGSLVRWRIANGASLTEPFALSAAARSMIRGNRPADVSAPIPIPAPSLDVPLAPSAPQIGAYGPVVCVAGSHRELVFSRTDLQTMGGVPDLRRSGHWLRTGSATDAAEASWTVRGSLPAVWQGSEGRRLVCVIDWESPKAYVYNPRPGARITPPVTTVELPSPPVLTQGMLLPYGQSTPRMLVALNTGVHVRAEALYDLRGHQIWIDPKEGPHPKPVALFRGPDGKLRFFVDNHGKHLLVDEADGRSVTVARGWFDEIPGRGDGAKYVLPIVGPFGPKGETRIILSPGLENLEILDTAGARIAKTPYGGIYERFNCFSAVGRIRSGNRWDVAMITADGVFHCADAATGKDRWTLDLRVASAGPMRIACGDIDGDGRDNFLIGLENGELVALDERNGKGVVLWKAQFNTAVRDTILADLDGDGLVEIIVQTDDLSIRVLKPAPTRTPNGESNTT